MGLVVEDCPYAEGVPFQTETALAALEDAGFEVESMDESLDAGFRPTTFPQIDRVPVSERGPL